MTRLILFTFLVFVGMVAAPHARTLQPDAQALEQEALQHFLAILRLDTQNPPGNEVLVVDYLKAVLEQAGHRRQDPGARSETAQPGRAAARQRHAGGRC